MSSLLILLHSFLLLLTQTGCFTSLSPPLRLYSLFMKCRNHVLWHGVTKRCRLYGLANSARIWATDLTCHLKMEIPPYITTNLNRETTVWWRHLSKDNKSETGFIFSVILQIIIVINNNIWILLFRIEMEEINYKLFLFLEWWGVHRLSLAVFSCEHEG